MDVKGLVLADLLKNRTVYEIFDEEFRRGTWLDASALVGSESSIEDLYNDKTVPSGVLDAVVERLEKLDDL